MAHSLVAIPEELLIQILSDLGAPSIMQCAMTCKSIYAVLKNSSLLSYIIQLHLDGLKDAGTSSAYPDLIESLVRRRQAWLSLDNKEPVTYRIKSNCFGCELAGGAFVHTSLSDDHLGIIRLPTPSNTTRHAHQTHSIGISAVRDFTTDLTQDLLVLLEDDMSAPSTTDTRIIRIHIRTLSTNAIHQQAQQSPLQFSVVPHRSYGNTINKVLLQIASNILAVSFRNASKETRVVIWDWSTSELILDTSASFHPPVPSLRYGFELLDSTYFLVTCPTNFGAIQLYRLVQSHPVTNRAIHLATLHFPPTSPGVTVPRIHSHAGPIEAYPLPNVPFTVHGDDRLHVFMLEYGHKAADSDRWRIRYFNLFLHQRVLLKYARRAHTENSLLDIPWAEWGPQNTRLTPSSLSPYASRWKRYIHGQRAIFPQGRMRNIVYGAVGFHTVEVYDFSLAAVLSSKGILGMPSSSPKGKSGTLLLSSTIRIEDFPLFINNVETHLPCVVSTLDLTQRYTSYMIYADGIIGMNLEDNSNFLLNIYPV